MVMARAEIGMASAEVYQGWVWSAGPPSSFPKELFVYPDTGSPAYIRYSTVWMKLAEDFTINRIRPHRIRAR